MTARRHGALRKPDEPRFRQFSTYEIADPGEWTIHKESDRVDFVHELDAGNGYAYVYRKTLRLTANAPELVLEHSLKNTGQKTINTTVYNHNFFTLDGEGPSEGLTITVPYQIQSPRPPTPALKSRLKAAGRSKLASRTRPGRNGVRRPS